MESSTPAETVNTDQQEEPEPEKEPVLEKSQSRSRSRSPLRTDEAKDLEEEDFSESEEMSNNDDSTLLNSTPFNKTPPNIDRVNRMFKPKLVLGNVPTAWTYEDVRNFIRGAVNSKHVADNVGYVCYRKSGIMKGEVGTSIVYFGTEAAANEACARLNDMEVNGRKLTASVLRCTEKLSPFKNRKFTEPKLRQAATGTAGNADKKATFIMKKSHKSNETYGLDLQYLNSLGLSPPLQPRIIVFNVNPKADKEKIREIFCLAGHIVDIHMIKKQDGTFTGSVKIEYNHPVEAVQAISMFKNQKLFNKTLILKMETNVFSYKRRLPTGLSGIGPGLGNNGDPLNYVSAHVELQSLKELIKNLATASRNSNQQQNVQQQPTPTVPNPNVPAVSLLTDLIKMCQWSGQMNVGGSQNDPTPNIQQNMGYFNNQIPGSNLPNAPLPKTMANVGNGNWQLQGNASNQSNQSRAYTELNQYKNDYGQSPSSSSNESYKRNRDIRNYKDTMDLDDDYFRNKCGDIIVFKNLPSSVTVEALRAKMSEVGELRGVEMTGLGKALVRFVRERDAEKCLKLFDRSKVDGHIIKARYF